MWLNSVLSKCVGLCNIGSWREGMQNYVGSQAGNKQLIEFTEIQTLEVVTLEGLVAIL